MRLPVLVLVALAATAAPNKHRPDAGAPPETKHSPELVEIAKILAPNGKPTLDPARLAKYKVDPNWDPRRTWLREVRQNGQSVTVVGRAVSEADLQEFASRLAADRNFGEVVIVDWKRAHDAESDLDCVDFKLQLRSLIAHPWAAPSVTRK